MAHKGAREDLTAEFVREILDYDPTTGVFRWKRRLSNRIHIGDIAGSPIKDRVGKSRLYIGIKGTLYAASRLA